MSNIKMYGTPTCKDCVIAKEVFKELGTDYEFINIDDVHPMNIELFLKINKAFKLNMSGIDFITDSLSTPYYLSDGNVLEVNWKPSFRAAIEFFPEPFILSLINNN